MSSFFLRQLHEDDKFILSKLRRDVISSEFSYVKDKILLNWGPTDRANRVYGVFHQSEIVSTIRLEELDSIPKYEARLEVSSKDYPIELPVAVTSRAATHFDYQGHGFHSVLKMICLMKALQLNHRYCLATIKRNSPRVSSFQKMGYELFHASDLWNGFLKDDIPPLFGRLNLVENGMTAIHYLKNRSERLLPKIQFEESLQELYEGFFPNRWQEKDSTDLGEKEFQALG